MPSKQLQHIRKPVLDEVLRQGARSFDAAECAYLAEGFAALACERICAEYREKIAAETGGEGERA